MRVLVIPSADKERQGLPRFGTLVEIIPLLLLVGGGIDDGITMMPRRL